MFIRIIKSVLFSVAVFGLVGWIGLGSLKKIPNEIVKPIRANDFITKLYIIGTVHKETENYNGDSIFNILFKINPDLILLEIDSSNFDDDFKLKQSLKHRLGVVFGFAKEENEELAIKKYVKLFPKTMLRPYEYEGRDAFHKRNEILTKPDAVYEKLSSLYKKGGLYPRNRKIWEEWLEINDSLSAFRGKTPLEYNSELFYRISAKRQLYQYKKINEIVQNEPDLEGYKSFYQIHSDFWDVRNKVMAQHIKLFIEKFPGKKIVVLTGANHKYYLLQQLKNESRLKCSISEYYKE